jgi:hypothetical protein
MCLTTGIAMLAFGSGGAGASGNWFEMKRYALNLLNLLGSPLPLSITTSIGQSGGLSDIGYMCLSLLFKIIHKDNHEIALPLYRPDPTLDCTHGLQNTVAT